MLMTGTKREFALQQTVGRRDWGCVGDARCVGRLKAEPGERLLSGKNPYAGRTAESAVERGVYRGSMQISADVLYVVTDLASPVSEAALAKLEGSEQTLWLRSYHR